MIGPDLDPDSDFCPCDLEEPATREFILKDPPCCATCPHCGHQILSEMFEQHIARHQEQAERAHNLELEARVLFPLEPLS